MTKQLEQLGDAVEGALRQTLAKQVSPEVRRRLQPLVDKIHEANRRKPQVLHRDEPEP